MSDEKSEVAKMLTWLEMAERHDIAAGRFNVAKTHRRLGEMLKALEAEAEKLKKENKHFRTNEQLRLDGKLPLLG